MNSKMLYFIRTNGGSFVLAFVYLTPSEIKTLRYLCDNCNTKKNIKLSNAKLGDKLGLTPERIRQILEKLESLDLIMTLVEGSGRRPNKYKVLKVMWHHILIKKRGKSTTKVSDKTSSPGKLVSDKQGKSKSPYSARSSNDVVLRTTPNISNDIYNKYEKIKTRTSAHTHAIKRQSSLISKIKPLSVTAHKAKITTGPFLKFEDKKYKPESWNANDIVCYYSYLFRSVYDTFPSINWPKDCGAARNLLRTFNNDPMDVKRYMQICFATSKNPPDSLSWFTQSWNINRSVKYWDREDITLDLEDQWVLN